MIEVISNRVQVFFILFCNAYFVFAVLVSLGFLHNQCKSFQYLALIKQLCRHTAAGVALNLLQECYKLREIYAENHFLKGVSRVNIFTAQPFL